MPRVVKHGSYLEENHIQCEECGCIFRYWNSEMVIHMTTPDEESFFGGFAVLRTIKCPDCKHMITLSYQFTEYESWVDKLCNLFKKKGKKDGTGK